MVQNVFTCMYWISNARKMLKEMHSDPFFLHPSITKAKVVLPILALCISKPLLTKERCHKKRKKMECLQSSLSLVRQDVERGLRSCGELQPLNSVLHTTLLTETLGSLFFSIQVQQRSVSSEAKKKKSQIKFILGT